MENKSELSQTLQDAILYFSDLEVSTQYVAKLRFPNGVVCVHCGAAEPYYLKTRRIWKCKHCGKQFSVKVGTIFEDSPIGLDKWLAAMWMIANAKNGIISYEIHRALGVTQKSAWFMLHRIRPALDKMGVQWLEKTQAYFKSRLDDIESNIKKHNCFCGFSCDDDRYFQTHVIREHQEFEIPQDAPIDPKFLQLDNEFPIMDESSFTGSWRGVCEKCGKRERYYHPSKQKLFALCSVCGMDAINALLAEIGVE